MNPKDLIDTIYLGDRFCKNVLIDGSNELVKIQMNMISRIRSDSRKWDYYNDENIKDGFIVFEQVEGMTMELNGQVPNDAIEFANIEEVSGDVNKYIFEISAASCDKNGNYEYGVIRIEARDIYLEDPCNPQIKITK